VKRFRTGRRDWDVVVSPTYSAGRPVWMNEVDER
jgi:hypothetical protein